MKEGINQFLTNYLKGDSSALIPVLQDIQEKFGYLSEEIIIEVGNYFNIPSSRVFET